MQAALERHVNAHFNDEANGHGSTNGTSTGGLGGKRSAHDHLPAKMVRRNSKKLKNRRKSAPGKTHFHLLRLL